MKLNLIAAESQLSQSYIDNNYKKIPEQFMIQRSDKRQKYENQQNAPHYQQASNFQPAPQSQPAWHFKSNQFMDRCIW